LKSTSCPLHEQLDHLRRSFRKLRQRSVFRKHVAGGYAVIEMTLNEQTHLWHPHLHVLVRTKHVDWRKLRQAWICITLGSTYIDCQVCKQVAQYPGYLACYLGKPPSETVLDDERLTREYYDAIYHGRFAIAFGDARRLPDDPEAETPVRSEPVKVAPLQTIMERAHRGDGVAVAILAELANRRRRQAKYEQSPAHADDLQALFDFSEYNETTVPEKPPDPTCTGESDGNA
jgi:hypothetical protein